MVAGGGWRLGDDGRGGEDSEERRQTCGRMRTDQHGSVSRLGNVGRLPVRRWFVPFLFSFPPASANMVQQELPNDMPAGHAATGFTISDLPTELLVSIFQCIPVENVVQELETDENKKADLSDRDFEDYFNGVVPFKVAWVCRDWRNVAFAAPGLWASWLLTIDTSRPEILDFLQLFITRSLRWSKGSALDIGLVMDPFESPELRPIPNAPTASASPAQRCDALEAVFSLLDRERPRWRRVAVSVVDPQLFSFFIKERVHDATREEPVPNSLPHNVPFETFQEERFARDRMPTDRPSYVVALSPAEGSLNPLAYVAFGAWWTWQIRFGTLTERPDRHSLTFQTEQGRLLSVILDAKLR